MTVAIAPDRIVLEGNCPVEDAETLLLALQDDPPRPVDLQPARRVHMAVIQVLLAARASVIGAPDDSFLRQHVLPSLLASSSSAREAD